MNREGLPGDPPVTWAGTLLSGGTNRQWQLRVISTRHPCPLAVSTTLRNSAMDTASILRPLFWHLGEAVLFNVYVGQNFKFHSYPLAAIGHGVWVFHRVPSSFFG